MGAIVYKGEYYGGSDVVEITQTDYDALPSEQKNNGTLYVIKDAPSIIDIIYPVGSIYMSVNNVNPGTYLKDTTWEAWGSGRVPVGVSSDTEFNTVEKTGGEKTHTLKVKELPAQAAIQARNPTSAAKSTSAVNASWASVSVAASASIVTSVYDAGVNGFVPFGESETTTGNTPHNNLQPYITCYMWKRTH